MTFCDRLSYNVSNISQCGAIYQHNKPNTTYSRNRTKRHWIHQRQRVAAACMLARRVPNRTSTGCHGSSCSTTSTPSSQPSTASGRPTRTATYPMWPPQTSDVLWEHVRVLRQGVITYAINLFCHRTWVILHNTCMKLNVWCLYPTTLWPNMTLLSDVVWLSCLVFSTVTYWYF